MIVGIDGSEKDIFFKRKGIEVSIPFSEESLGNQNLLRILPSFLTIIENGSSVKKFSTKKPRSAQMIEKMYVNCVFGGLPDYKEVQHEDQ